MKQQFIYLSLILLIISGCKSSRLTTEGSDDVYFRSPTEIRSTNTASSNSPEATPQGRYENGTSYGTYEDESDLGYTSYSSRILRFHDPFLTFDYYSPYYSPSFSFGFSWSNYGYTSPWNNYYNPWCSNYNYYDPFQQYSWYNSYAYPCSNPFFNYYNPWGYYPIIPYNYYGWSPWRPQYPWYNNNDHNYYHPPTENKPSYYGPRNWSGSNTNSNNYWGTGKENIPSSPDLPGNNSNYGKSITPSGIQINKGDKTGTNKIEPRPLPSNNSAEPGIQNPKPKQEIKYYRPAEKSNNEKPLENKQPDKNNEPGIKINKGSK